MLTAAGPHRVAILGLAPVIGYDLTIPAQILGHASGVDGAPLYEVAVVGLTREPLATLTGYGIVPSYDASWLAHADSVIIPGTAMAGPRYHGTVPDDLATALAMIRPGTRIMSICTGAFVLAAAGYLDGRRATTHWAKAEEFRALYPQVDLDPDVLFVDDGDVLTSAGLGAGVDLCLHVLRRDHGAEVANAVARYCVVPPWREGGQAQYIERALPMLAADSTAVARAYALTHLDDDLSVPGLAAHAQMSVRTFTRRFRAETGVAPGSWLIQQRIRYAQRLLETTDLPVDQVAARSGLGTGASLRGHLKAAAGVTPLAYRRTFRAADPDLTEAG